MIISILLILSVMMYGVPPIFLLLLLITWIPDSIFIGMLMLGLIGALK